MALVPATLEARLNAIYIAMDKILDGTGDDYQAREVAKAIKEFILTGQTSTADSGDAPAGDYKGAGIGTMTIDADALESALAVTFKKASDNPTLASNIAADIDNACKEDDTISETSSGIVTTSSGATVSFSGPAVGKFSGDKSKISIPLAACFEAMNGMMTAGVGNAYYANQMSLAVYSYLTGGEISVELKPPFVSGSGAGAIA
jgi:hypothetical protein